MNTALETLTEKVTRPAGMFDNGAEVRVDGRALTPAEMDALKEALAVAAKVNAL